MTRPRSFYRRFREAVIHGNLSRTKHLILNEGLSTTTIFEDGESVLTLAAKHQHCDIVSLLLQLNTPSNQKNRKGETPLAVAVTHGNLAIATYLLLSGSKVNSLDKNHSTPLHFAAKQGNVSLTQLLLEHGADVNLPTKGGKRAIHLVIESWPEDELSTGDFTKTVLQLLVHGANIHSFDKACRSPLWCSVQQGDKTAHVSRILLSKGSDISHKGPLSSLPITIATKKGYFEQCKVLIDFNSPVDLVLKHDGKQCSLLDVAVLCGFAKISCILTAAGCERICHEATPENSQVYPLKVLSRKVVRRCVGKNIHQKVPQLQYPEALKDYVLMRNDL